MEIDYYYTLMSPWAYFGALRFYKLQKKYKFLINHYPLDIMQLFPISGGEPLGKRAEQRKAYRMMELKRWQKKLNIPINFTPKFFPPSDVSIASSMILGLKNSEQQNNFSYLLLKCVWVDELDIGDINTLRNACNYLKLDFNNLFKSSQDKMKLYHSLSEKAAKLNVFGSPSYVINGEIFWGQDRLELLEEFIKENI